jgi:hypothetical protein
MKLAGLCARLRRLCGLDQETAAAAGSRLSAAAELYQAGLASAKLGDFVGCLRLWRQTDSGQPDFLAQSLLLIEELHCRLDGGPLAQEEEVRALLEEFALSDLPSGGALLARCRSLRLARLWQEERLEELAALADETDWLQPAALAVQAKAACQLLAAEEPVPAARLRFFIDAWLTLLFHPQAGPQTETQRQALLDFGEARLRRQAARQPDSGAALLRLWEETLALLRRLRSLTDGPVYAPALALRAGLSAQHFALIHNSREAFADDGQWTAAGAAYSSAAPALLLIREGGQEAALDALADIEEGDDPFAAWGAAQVRAACAARCLRDGQHREAEQILTGGPAHWTAELERQLLNTLENEELDGGRLTACLSILNLLPENSGAAAAFCAALTDQALRLRVSEAHPRLLAAVTSKAAALQPGDELARTMREQACLSLELAQISEAFACDCFAEAARTAAASRFPQTREHFFENARQAAARIECCCCPDQEAAVFMLEELLRGVCAVDASHSAVRRMQLALDILRAAA